MTSIEKLIEVANSLGIVGAEAMDFVIAQQKHEHKDRKAQ